MKIPAAASQSTEPVQNQPARRTAMDNTADVSPRAADTVEFSDAGLRRASQGQGQTPEARLQALAQHIEARIQHLASQLGEEATRGLARAQEVFTQHLERVRNALENGSLRPEGVAAAMRNALGYLQDNVQAALKSGAAAAQEADVAPSMGTSAAPSMGASGATADPSAGLSAASASVDPGSRANDPAPAGDPAGHHRQRLASLGAHIAQRIATLDLDHLAPRQAEALAAAHADFVSALERIDQGVFETGTISREQFASLLQGVLSQLSSSFQAILGTGSDVA